MLPPPTYFTRLRRCACLPLFSDAAAFAQRIAVELSSSSCTASLSIVLLLSSPLPSACPSAHIHAWPTLLSALSLMPTLTPSHDLIKLWQRVALSSLSLPPPPPPAPGSAMAVAAVAALHCAGSISSHDARDHDVSDSMNSQLSSILYAVAIAAAADGDNKRSRDLLTACGRLGGVCKNEVSPIWCHCFLLNHHSGFMGWRCRRALVTLLSGKPLSVVAALTSTTAMFN